MIDYSYKLREPEEKPQMLYVLWVVNGAWGGTSWGIEDKFIDILCLF